MTDTQEPREEPRPGEKSPARQFVLGDLATNRILFALALLGVLLPVNNIVNRYHHLDFIYLQPHQSWLAGPYHVRLIAALYLMEGLLATAVYLYSFYFIFKITFIEIVGTTLYAISLFVPVIYFYILIYQQFTSLIGGFSGLTYWIVSSITLLALGFIIGVIVAIVERLLD
jgi:hypothetical protein